MSFTSAFGNVEIKTSDEMNNSLNELFNVVYDKSPSRQKPLNQRQLPESFFVPPSGSSISSNSCHYKALSSPATLEETYCAGPGNQPNNHFKQRSLDTKNFNQHFNKLHNNISNIESKSHSPEIDSNPRLHIEVEKLPSNYQMAIDDEGRVYFLNHAKRETSWIDPRLPKDIQKSGMTLRELQELHVHCLSARHLTTKTQPSIALHRSQQPLTGQAHHFPESKSQIHFRSGSQPVSSSGTSLGLSVLDTSSVTLSHFQVTAGQSMAHVQYFGNSNAGGGNFHDMSHLHPHCSSVRGSQSGHSNNSSCSNLSSCLNSLNLSPVAPLPQARNAMVVTRSQHGGNISLGQNTVGPKHMHQDSLDSGVGQSVVSQSHLSYNMYNQNNDKAFDMPLG